MRPARLHDTGAEENCASGFLASSDKSSSLIDNAETPSLMAWMNLRISRPTAAKLWRPRDRLAWCSMRSRFGRRWRPSVRRVESIPLLLPCQRARECLGKARLRDRDEEEVRGYRNALRLIHERHAKVRISERTIRELHRLSRGRLGDAGKCRARESEIIELQPSGRRLQVLPVPPWTDPAPSRRVARRSRPADLARFS